MDRAEKIGLAAALTGHFILFGLLSVGFLSTPNPEQLKPSPIEVSLVEDVGLVSQAPASVEPPAPSIAPDQGPPEDAAPPAPETAPPEPAPEPEPAPPAPAPAPEPRPAPKAVPKAAPRPPRPAPAERPPERKAAPRPQPKAAPKAAPKAERPPAKAAPKTATANKGSGSDAAATKARPRGNRLGDDFLKGLSDTPSQSKAANPPGAASIDARALAGIRDAIRRQIQPCADKQVNPGPGANAIVTVLNLKLNRDGTLAATPRTVRQTGVDGENERYAQRVTDLGIAAFRACAPLRLPAEYYETANGGWSNINYNWQLR